MKTVFALFSQPSDADNAVGKLKDAGLDTEKAHIHSQQTIGDSISVTPAVGPATGTPSGGTTPAGTGAAATGAAGGFLTDENVQSYLDKLDVPADQQAFFAHGIKEGGSLVHIDVSDDESETAERVLAEAGGRASQAE